MRCWWFAPIVLLPVAAVSCANSVKPTTTTQTRETTVSTEEVLVDGLDTPTQFVELKDQRLLIAQLNGDENGKLGQILIADQVTKKQRVLIDHLDKPTGVAYIDNTIWVMVKRGLLRAKWDGTSTTPEPPEVVLSDLPFNGRSEGTLTPLPDGRLLYETSGNSVGDSVEEGSGTLWAYDPKSARSTVVATGLKNAYAHVILSDNRIVTTEISGDNSNPPPDAIVIVPANPAKPPNFGWPQCRPDSRDDWKCASVTRPLATLPKNSTPTGVAIIGTRLYVALWVNGEIWRIDLDKPQAKATPVVFGLTNPHTLGADADGRLLFSDGAGRIVRLRVD
jgi:glucose/arabinose dehydrogenase